MTFDGSKIAAAPGTLLQEDRFRVVEIEQVYRQISCYQCETTHIYKYKIKQLRRKSQDEVEKGGRLTSEQEEFWRCIPRYAEIPETLRCKHCGEILGLYTDCIY